MHTNFFPFLPDIMDSINACSKEELDLAKQNRMDGFPDHKDMSKKHYIIAGIQTLLLILGLALNFIICYVMVRRRKVKKNLSNFFLFNLSLTELILWVAVLPMTMIITMTTVKNPIGVVFILQLTSTNLFYDICDIYNL